MEKSPPPSVIADKLDPEIITVAPGIACPYALVIVPCIVVWAKEDSHISASHARNINDTRKALLYFLIEQSVLDNNEDSGWTKGPFQQRNGIPLQDGFLAISGPK